MADTRRGSREQPDYLSYLLRLWRVPGAEPAVWRAALKSASTGEQVEFASLEELFDCLWVETGSARSTEEGRVINE